MTGLKAKEQGKGQLFWRRQMRLAEVTTLLADSSLSLQFEASRFNRSVALITCRMISSSTVESH